jgi:hypothetical protein
LGASKKISIPMEHSAQTMYLSIIKINSLQIDQNELPLDPCHVGVPSGASKMINEPMVCLRKPCTYLVSRLTLPPNRPTSSIKCAQDDFLACGLFGANRAPIFRRD